MSEAGQPQLSLRSDIIGGAGLGLLIGVLVGLSSSPVVGVVVGALASILAVFLGLDVGASSIVGRLGINGPRIGALGLATVIGLGVGLYVRVNNPFLPEPQAQLARWQAALPDDPTLAKQLMVLERTGIEPSHFHYGAAPPAQDIKVAAQATPGTQSAVLFSTLSQFDVCTRINPTRYAASEDLLAAYSRSGAPPVLPKIAASIANLPNSEQATALAVSHEVLCLLQQEEAE